MITVPENSPVGVPLLQVFTTDSDEGVNMVAEYSILDAPNRDTIAINETTGEISFASPPTLRLPNGWNSRCAPLTSEVCETLFPW